MGTLDVFLSLDGAPMAEDEGLAARAVTDGVAAVPGRIGWRELVEAGWRAAGGGRRARLGTVGERLLVETVAEEASGPLASLVGTGGFAAGLGSVLGAWRRAGVRAAALAQIAERSVGGRAPRTRELARLYRLYGRLLGERADEAEVVRAAGAALQGAPDVPLLDGVRQVVLHDVESLDGGQLGVLDGLLRRGLLVKVRVPYGARRPVLEAAVHPLLRELERRHDLFLEIEFVPVEGKPRDAEDAPRMALLQRLFSPRQSLPPTVLEGVPLWVVAAPSPDVEARTVARRVRDLVAGGVPAEEIAVVARDPARQARVAEWLARYGLPPAQLDGTATTAAPPLRLALALYELLDESVPREALIALLASRYVQGGVAATGGEPAVAPHRVARLLRAAGVRDASDEEGLSGYRRRLGELVRASTPAQRPAAQRAAEHVDEVLAAIGALPGSGTVAQHGAALRQLLDRLELRPRAVNPAGASDDVAVARDQAAVTALYRGLAALERAAGRGELSRRRYARLLATILDEAPLLPPAGARCGAVLLGAPERAVGRRFAHLFYLGLEEGEVPAHHPEESLLGDDERRALNRALGVEALPLAAHEDALEPQRFVRALATAGALHLSYSTTDGNGKPAARSPYLDEIERVAAFALETPGHDPIPRAADARLTVELLARVGLEAEADPVSRLGAPDESVGPALLAAARAAEPAAQVAAVIAIERARLAFFADGSAVPHPHVGGLRDGALIAALAEVLPGTPERPLSPSAIEDYAQCGFRFFLRRVLRSQPPEEAGDELDPMAGGRLDHRVLERFYRALAARARLPLRGEPADHALLDQVCDEVLASWSTDERRGHPALFAARAPRTRRQLHALVTVEARQRWFAPLLPSRFEHPFTLTLAAPDGGAPLHLRGKIDRVDVDSAGGRALVLDYKSGRSQSYRRRLTNEELLVTSFQLPIYAAAIERELGHPTQAGYLAIRDAAPTPTIASAPAPLAAALSSLHRRMLGGDFAVRPRSCEHCDLESTCRVVVQRSAEEEELDLRPIEAPADRPGRSRSEFDPRPLGASGEDP